MADRLSVRDQVARTAADHATGFDPVVLGLTLSLYRTTSALDRAHNEELAPVRLSVSQFNVLNVLHRADEALTMGELGHAVSVRPANLTTVVDSLSERGFVQRRVNPHDRRSFLVAITADGETFLGEFLPGHWIFLKGLFEGLDGKQREQLGVLLDALLDSLETREGAAPAAPRPARGTRRTGALPPLPEM